MFGCAGEVNGEIALTCLGRGLRLLGCKIGEMNALDKLVSYLARRLFERTAISNLQSSRGNRQDHADSAMIQQLESAQGAVECSSLKIEVAYHPSTIPRISFFFFSYSIQMNIP